METKETVVSRISEIVSLSKVTNIGDRLKIRQVRDELITLTEEILGGRLVLVELEEEPEVSEEVPDQPPTEEPKDPEDIRDEPGSEPDLEAEDEFDTEIITEPPPPSDPPPVVLTRKQKRSQSR